MTTHSSATPLEQTPHANQTTRTSTIANALKRRAQSVLNDTSINAQTREIVRYALETNDPCLAELVRRADAGESIADTTDFSQTPKPNEDDSIEKVKALAEIICQGGDESAGALLVLMGMLQNSTQPKVLANTAKYLAFTRCGELNLYGMVDTQIAVVQSKLLAGTTLNS